MAGMGRVTFLITDLHRGGSPLLLADLAPGLAQRGWDVDVVSIAPREEVAELLEARGICVTSLEARFNRDLAVIPRFVRHVRERRPNVVLSVLIHANLLATMAKPFVGAAGTAGGVKWVQSIHTLQEKPRWHWTLQTVLLRHADGFVAPSRAIVRKLEGLGAEVPGGGVVVANGIDVGRFYGARAVTEVPWGKGAVVVGAVGRFDPVKRLELLIAALRYLPGEYQAALVGYGPQEGALRRMAGELGLTGRVHFVGATAEPERWYKAFDIYCNLSSSEGFGLTLAEACCAGVPIVTCDTAAIRETLEGAGGTTWLGGGADPEATEVARGIIKARGGAGSRMGLEGLERRYGRAGMVEGYEGLLRGVMAAGKSA